MPEHQPASPRAQLVLFSLLRENLGSDSFVVERAVERLLQALALEAGPAGAKLPVPETALALEPAGEVVPRLAISNISPHAEELLRLVGSASSAESTPCLLLDGGHTSWTPEFKDSSERQSQRPGLLSAALSNDSCAADFKPQAPSPVAGSGRLTESSSSSMREWEIESSSSARPQPFPFLPAGAGRGWHFSRVGPDSIEPCARCAVGVLLEAFGRCLL
eukprot:CAMPEP_0206244958 /NCGR_PEP_ID=MMETSP0047_2-20121206/18442_1 /ASSEMBLY_ACC=CAM_ASM_000192 /TAXON_ID=195065 /ORGANISM="Chroomonas mesostigmatica_cf, Strain CCMP1168" /LENGTH=218 /DNA_ID=CAMNT_0053670227 /DNA_START=110 /DNA_END=763 /DNA_ORIENTATION=-